MATKKAVYETDFYLINPVLDWRTLPKSVVDELNAMVEVDDTWKPDYLRDEPLKKSEGQEEEMGKTKKNRQAKQQKVPLVKESKKGKTKGKGKKNKHKR